MNPQEQQETLQQTLSVITVMRDANIYGSLRSQLLTALGFGCYVKPGIAFARQAQVEKAQVDNARGNLNCEQGAYEVTADGNGWWPVNAEIFDLTYEQIADFKTENTQQEMLLQDGWAAYNKVGRQWLQQWGGPNICIETLEGPRVMRTGDWLCVGVKNEVYPIENERIGAYVPVV